MMMVELEGPAVLPVLLADFKRHLQLGSGFDADPSQDEMLEMYLRSATQAVESRIGKALITRRLQWRITRWRHADAQGLPVAPIQAIEALQIVDRLGASTAIDASAYRLVEDDFQPLLSSQSAALPVIPSGGHAELTLRAGFGDAPENVPADLRHAVLMLAAKFFEDRFSDTATRGVMPFGVLALLEPFRRLHL